MPRHPNKFLVKITLISAFFLAAQGVIFTESVLTGELKTKDNVSISYEYYKSERDTVVIICPGFYNSKDNRWMKKTVELIRPSYDVIIIDMRGHGSSGGKFTWGAKEDMDIETAVDFAKSEGYRHIGILAFSLAAGAAVNTASKRNDIESMVLISCPSDAGTINFHFWEPAMLTDLIDNIQCGWQGKGARTTHFFLRKEKPLKSIANIKNTAILFIHGTRDWVIKDLHSKKLYDAFPGKKKLHIAEGGLHAERLIEFKTEEMRKLILEWFGETLR